MTVIKINPRSSRMQYPTYTALTVQLFRHIITVLNIAML